MQEPGRPRFVSVLAYLNSRWGLDEHAETLFLDAATDTGAFVRPRPGRIVLMDQDVLHRASAPATAARRPRYSLVWKLLASPTPPSRTPAAVRPACPASPTAAEGAPGSLRASVAPARTGEDEEAPSSDTGATAGRSSDDRADGRRQWPGGASACDGEACAEVDAARRAAQRATQRTVSILLPEHGGVTAFGSARRMRDLQDRVAGAAGGPSAKKARRS